MMQTEKEKNVLESTFDQDGNYTEKRIVTTTYMNKVLSEHGDSSTSEFEELEE